MIVSYISKETQGTVIRRSGVNSGKTKTHNFYYIYHVTEFGFYPEYDND